MGELTFWGRKWHNCGHETSQLGNPESRSGAALGCRADDGRFFRAWSRMGLLANQSTWHGRLVVTTVDRMVFDAIGGIPGWLSDTFRCIYDNKEHKLSSSDIERLAALLMGALDGDENDIHPFVPPNTSHEVSNSQDIRLFKIHALNNVNALDPKWELEFNPKGLTIIFGKNGAGKSGYARVIKRACNARAQGDKILSNVFQPDNEQLSASAKFKWGTVNNGEYPDSEDWTDNGESVKHSLSVAVYDSQVARVVLDNKGEPTYRPGALDLLAALVEASQDIRENILPQRDSIHQHLVNVLPKEIAGTRLGELVTKILDKSSPLTPNVDEIQQCIDFSEEDFQELDDIIKENIDSEKQSQKAKNLREDRDNISEMRKQVNQATEQLAAIEAKLPFLLREFKQAQKEAQDAQKIFDEKYLPDTGGEIWKNMFLAAEKFSTLAAYRKETFPFVSEKARCVLCQQALKEEGVEALNLFRRFVQDHVAMNLAKWGKDIKDVQNTLNKIGGQMEKIRENNALMSMIKSKSEDAGNSFSNLPTLVQKFVGTILDQKENLMKAANSDPYQVPKLPDNPDAFLHNLSEWMSDRADKYDKIASKRKQMESSHKKMQAMKKILQEISSFKQLILLNRCLNEIANCKRDITIKVNRISDEAINKELKDLLNKELDCLRSLASDKKIRFEYRGEQGRRKMWLIIDDENYPKNVPLSKVLSEGEQNGIALASFLAENSAFGGAGTLVFDDPASSADDDRIEAIATRLRDIADKRQVIVFTHDIQFSRLLAEGGGVKKIGVRKQRKKVGQVDYDVVPFGGLGYAEQIKKIKKDAADWDNSSLDGAEEQEKLEIGYPRIRKAIESLTEDGFLERVVSRRSTNVSVASLPRVFDVPDERAAIAKRIRDLYKKASPRLHDAPRISELDMEHFQECVRDLLEIHADLNKIQNESKKRSRPNG